MVKKPDLILLTAVAILIVLGLVILASVSAPFAHEKFGNTFYFLKHQILLALIPGLILGLVAFRLNLAWLKKWAPLLLLMNLAALSMVFLPVVGSRLGGAARWVGWGFLSFQPAEFLKLTFILYLASWLVSRAEKTTNQKEFSRTFLAFLLIISLISLLLILQPNISTLAVIVFIAVLMYFSIKTPLWHSILMLLLGSGGLYALMKIAPYRANRLLVFFNPEADPMGIGYQLKQVLISVGSGGVKGVGLGMSSQKWGFLPESIADSIFAVFAEETGLIGSFFLIFLFLIFFWRGIKIVRENQNKFSQLTALGIMSWIVIQSFINIGAMTGLLPLTGIPLPFISYGGSALIAELIGVGILLNISKQK